MEENQDIKVADLSGIKVGDVVRFRSRTDIRYLSLKDQIICSWNSEMNYLCGQTRIITDEIMQRIEWNDRSIWVEKNNGNHWNVSLSMLEFYNPDEDNIDNDEKKDQEIIDENRFSIISKEKDQEIIDEMIAKVDKVRFKKLLTIGTMNKIDFKGLSKEVIDKYLKNWAEAKYEFYLLFGKKFIVEKDIEVEVDDSEMKSKKTDLCFLFPQYSAIIQRFAEYEWIQNKCDGDDVFKKYSPQYKDGMKVSKFLSVLIGDKKFDDAVANMLANRKINAKIAISIDPYDYLTMSINNYDWQSCHQLGEGCYSTGPLSLMIDNSTLIAYKYNGVPQHYNYMNFKFDGNSKSWRQSVYFDKSSGSMIFSRQYPTEIDDVTKLVREFMEEIVSKKLDVKNLWIVKTNEHDGYEEGSDCPYHDVDEGFGHEMVILKEKPESLHTKFMVGKDILCVKCGDTIDDSRSTLLCYECD